MPKLSIIVPVVNVGSLVKRCIENKEPVLLIGETGCGKTLLLETLSIISGKTLKTLNVHAGITEKDVFSFMEGVINQNNLSDFWIFFDEINTSNAIGLIEEIMINHSMRGIPISNKLTFIAAYGKKEKYKK